MRLREVAELRLKLGDRLHIVEQDSVQRRAGKMHMRILKPRRHEPAFQIHHHRGRAGFFGDFAVATHSL